MTSGVSQLHEIENRFLYEHRDALRQEYGGQWIVIDGEALIASDADRLVAMNKGRDAGIAIPYVVYMMPADAPSVFFAPVWLH
jgi:hypothetical protein